MSASATQGGHKNESKHSGPSETKPTQRTCVSIALCTIVAHNIAQNRPDNFPSYPLDNHHCSDDVYLREGGFIVDLCIGLVNRPNYISRESQTMRNVYQSRASVCVCACLSLCRRILRLLHEPGCKLGEWQGQYYWADLQSVHGFRCHDNTVRTRNVSECLYSLYAWFSLLLL